MKEIKFRVWDGSEFIEFWLGNCNETLNELFTLKRYVFQQFTGLCDKNGKEIYEGDVVVSLFPYNDKHLKNVDVVVWHNETCSFKLGPRIFHEGLILEVIGNIYKNPDLLA